MIRPRTPRFVYGFLLGTLVLALAFGTGGPASAELRVCPDESEAMLSDGTVRRQTYRAVEDPTAGGALRGQPPGATEQGRSGPDKMVLMLDYSGSMFPGYNRESAASCPTCAERTYYYQLPRFQNLLGDWLDAATPASGDLGPQDMGLEVLLFNARSWRLSEEGEVQPFEGPDQLTFERPVGTASAPQISSWLARIPGDPKQVDSRSHLTTESRQALLDTVTAVTSGEVGEAIVWLVTDNIVDTGGGGVSAEDAQRNLEFYNVLKSDPRIQMIVTYPVLEADQCSWMCGTSLFVYGMYVSAYERPDSLEFHRLGGTTVDGDGPTEHGLLWNSALRRVAAEVAGTASSPQADTGNAADAVEAEDLAGVPLRLKPIDTEVLSLEFQLHGGQALNCDRSAEFGDALLCLAQIDVRNTLRHQSVDSAHLRLINQVMLPRKAFERKRLPWASSVCADQMEPLRWLVKAEGQETRRGEGAEPIEVGPLPPLGAATIEVLFRLPTIDVETGGREHLLDVALTPQILLDGRMVAELADIRTSLAIDPERLRGIYGTAELPAIFRGRQQSRLWAEYPAAAVVSNDGQMFGLLVLFGGGGLLLLAILLFLRFQRLQYTVLVDGVENARLSLPRISSRNLEIDGAERARLRRGWGAQARFEALKGHRLRKEGGGWILTLSQDDSFEYRLEVRRGWAGRWRDSDGMNDDW